ncbi:BMC domain-containing protein [Actinoplanes sp. NPDC023801]|uniref:BMC domain-containing protein n=1 Tax=Actinoplanes sp. NPDC023801 TaxID=3154595 RepID=UPI0033C3760B
MSEAIGLVECRGLVATMVAVEAMCKAAAVRCARVDRVSGGILIAVVIGDLASVDAAVAAAVIAVRQYGQDARTQIYPRPEPAAARLLVGSGRLEGGSAG